MEFRFQHGASLAAAHQGMRIGTTSKKHPTCGFLYSSIPKTGSFNHIPYLSHRSQDLRGSWEAWRGHPIGGLRFLLWIDLHRRSPSPCSASESGAHRSLQRLESHPSWPCLKLGDAAVFGRQTEFKRTLKGNTDSF